MKLNVRRAEARDPKPQQQPSIEVPPGFNLQSENHWAFLNLVQDFNEI